MSGQDIISILPMIVLAVGTLLTMLLVALKRNHMLAFSATMIVLTTSLMGVTYNMKAIPHAIGELFIIDAFGLYYQSIILMASIAIAIFSYISLRNFFTDKRKEEYYLLLMLAILGASMMVISTHFISFFVSLEILSVSLYTLISYYRERTKAIEAGLKYLILAAMSSAFLLFGMALIYAITGTMSFSALSTISSNLNSGQLIMLMAGFGMMMVGFAFKLALAPFHIWAPDVYEGASSPVTALITTVSKGAVVGVLLRFFMMANLYQYEKVMLAFIVIAIVSMLVGNLLALQQNNVKRMLAYSSIAHFGYLLIAFIAGKEMGSQAATFYITVYIIAILGAFGLITLISRSDNEATNMEEYNGLFWRKPFMAALFTIILLSLAGIPLTAGFMAKYFLLTAGVGEAKWLLAFTLVAGSVIGLFYYLRVIVTMMKQEKDIIPGTSLSRISSYAGVLVLIILGVLIMALGVSPGWLIDMMKRLL